MRLKFLKQAEVFSFIAALLLIAVVMGGEDGSDPIPAPPIIVLPESEQRWRFESGSEEIRPEFRAAIENEIIPRLESLSALHGCDTIEVVGHTDGIPVRSRSSTLDGFSRATPMQLTPGSNVDLGMLRALALVAVLRENRGAGRLGGIRFVFPYSAGQMILPDLSLSKGERTEDPERRRLEIRLVRSTDVAIGAHATSH